MLKVALEHRFHPGPKLPIYDREFGTRMEAMFESDLKHSTEYTLQQFKNRSFWERVTEALMLPFRSQL